VKELAAAYTERFPHTIKGPHRLIGREAEFIVVNPDGSSGDVQRLLARMQAQNPSFEVHYGLEAPPNVLANYYKNNRDNNVVVKKDGEWLTRLGGDPGGGVVDYCVEVGTGTVEIVGAPCSNLQEMEKMFEHAMRRLIIAANADNQLVLGVGIQPSTPASEAIMTPRRRYGFRLSAIGPGWLPFTITASDQTHVDVDRHELMDVVNVCNALTPVIISLCANSSVYQAGTALCGRDAEMGLMQSSHPFRYGMPAKPAATILEWVDALCELDDWSAEPGSTALVRGSFRQKGLEKHTAMSEALMKAFLVHDKSVFHGTRPRAHTNTVELRMACQQPWRHHMCVAALNLGIVEGHRELAQLLQQHWGPPSVGTRGVCDFAAIWEKMRQAGAESTRTGLLESPEWQRFIVAVLHVCVAQLRKRGMKEEVYLEPLLYREQPGRKYATYFKEQGLEAFVRLVSINQFFK
jgi:hypothetical protein